MLGYLKDYKRESVLAPLFKMLEATFDLFVPLVMADIVNIGIAAHDFHYILVRCGILLLLAMIGLACSLTAQYFSAKAAVGYSTALRHALFEHIQTLSFTEMDTLGTSTLITRMTSDVNQVQSGLNLFLRLFLRSPFVVIGAMVMAFTVNSRAALIFVVTIPLLSVVVFGIMAATRPLYKTVQNRLDRVLGLTRENLTGVRVVRAFDKEKSEVERFENANDLLTKMQLHVGHISALMNPLTYVLINIAIVALLYVGSIEINVGGMAPGYVAIFDKENIFNNSFVNSITPGFLVNFKNVIIIFLITMVAKYLLDWYMSTKSGFLLRAVGDNDTIVTSLGVDKGLVKIVGLSIANGLVSLSGCIYAQQQRSFEISIGTGAVVIGLASVIIGTSLFKKITFFRVTSSVVVGSILYKACVAVAMFAGISPNAIKLITAVLFLIILVISMDRKKVKAC